MTVYVDDIRIAARVDGRFVRWSHLYTDDPTHAQLHTLAERIGLKREWFRYVNKLGQPYRWWQCHYDVTSARRDMAIKAGAVPIDWRDWATMAARLREASDV